MKDPEFQQQSDRGSKLWVTNASNPGQDEVIVNRFRSPFRRIGSTWHPKTHCHCLDLASRHSMSSRLTLVDISPAGP